MEIIIWEKATKAPGIEPPPEKKLVISPGAVISTVELNLEGETCKLTIDTLDLIDAARIADRKRQSYERRFED